MRKKIERTFHRREELIDITAEVHDNGIANGIVGSSIGVTHWGGRGQETKKISAVA